MLPARGVSNDLLLTDRKAKASLLEVDLPALQKLVKKCKTTPEQLKDREAKVPLLCCHASAVLLIQAVDVWSCKSGMDLRRLLR